MNWGSWRLSIEATEDVRVSRSHRTAVLGQEKDRTRGFARASNSPFAARVEGSAARHLRILVAEDNKVNQALSRRLLETRGHIVTIACDGLEAIAAFKRDPYDLILMDVQMPNLDGLAATKAIRQCEMGQRKIPIIALTAHVRSSDRDECLAAGMNGFVTKPIQASELSTAISELVGDNPEVDQIAGMADTGYWHKAHLTTGSRYIEHPYMMSYVAFH